MVEMKSILAVTDLTPASDAALTTAAALADASQCSLHVINGAPARLPFSDFMRMTFSPRGFAKNAAEIIDNQIARTMGESRHVTRDVFVDSFARMILHIAQQKRASLIVLSRSLNLDLIEALTERSDIATMVVAQEALQLPIRSAALPLMSAVPNRNALLAASVWVEALGGLRYEQLGAEPPPVDLELVQIAPISAATGSAAGVIRTTLQTEPLPGTRGVALSWRAGGADAPQNQLRRIARREDVDLVIVTLRKKRRGAARPQMRNTHRLLIHSSRAPVLIVPVAAARALAAA